MGCEQMLCLEYFKIVFNSPLLFVCLSCIIICIHVVPLSPADSVARGQHQALHPLLPHQVHHILPHLPLHVLPHHLGGEAAELLHVAPEPGFEPVCEVMFHDGYLWGGGVAGGS